MPFGIGFFATAGAGGAAGSFDLLQTQVLGTAAASVTFSNLNSTYGSTYQHLQLRLVARATGNSGATGDFLLMRFNADSASNYSMHQSQANQGSSTVTSAAFLDNAIYLQRITTAGNSANDFGFVLTDILDAFESTKFKTSRSLGGFAPQTLNLTSGSWRNSAALTSISIQPSSSNFEIGSRFSLYGIKAA